MFTSRVAYDQITIKPLSLQEHM